MHPIQDGGALSRALSSSIDERIKQLLRLRSDQLGGDIAGHARFLVVEAGDTLESFQTALGWAITDDPELGFGCEWVADHGAFYEALWVLTDCGFAHVALVAKSAGVDPRILSFCAAHASQLV